MKKPWQDEFLNPPSKKWLDENPEMAKEIPPLEERTVSFHVRQLKDTPVRVLLLVIGSLPIFLFFEKRHGRISPIIEVSESIKAGSTIFFFLILGIVLLLGRHEKGRIDIYPEMMVFYDYDHDRKKASKTYSLLLLERRGTVLPKGTLSMASFQGNLTC